MECLNLLFDLMYFEKSTQCIKLLSSEKKLTTEGKLRSSPHNKPCLLSSFGWWFIYPTGSMSGIFSYIYLIFMANVGKYTMHGSYVCEIKIAEFTEKNHICRMRDPFFCHGSTLDQLSWKLESNKNMVPPLYR